MTAKDALRTRLRALRKALTPEARATAQEAIARQLDRRLADARVVAAYAATGSELDLATWVDGFVARGGTIAWPVVTHDRAGLGFALCARTALVPGYRGIPEPPPDAPRLDLAGAEHVLDAVLVPGLGFDAAGHRLGQGGGFYDRLLTALRMRALADPSARMPAIIGVAFAAQLVAHIPSEPHDQAVDEVVTDASVSP